jgi:hypothetical protein
MTVLEYPMAIYSPEGKMFIVQDADERKAVAASWEIEPEAGDVASEEPVKRGPGRPRKNP